MELYEILSERRRLIGMSMEELVEKSQVAKGTVTKIMAGITRNPQIESLKAITYALGLRLEDLDTTDSDFGISAEARVLAERYDKLDSHGKKVVLTVLDLESERCADALSGLIARQKEAIDQMRADESTSANEA